MHSSTILAAILTAAGAASAAPRVQRDIYYGISIGAIVSPGLDPQKVLEPVPVEINKLAPCYGDNNDGCSVSELIAQNGTASNVNINQVSKFSILTTPTSVDFVRLTIFSIPLQLLAR